jgi:universal stress protein E
MMKIPKQILVVVSGKHDEHPALERALKFASVEDIHIHLFNSIYEPVMELTDVLSSNHRKELKRQYMADRRLYMDTLVEHLAEKDIKSTIHLTWHRELHEAIEDLVAELKPDLVIKRISADASNINPFTMPVDRHLIRHCQAPLLLVRESHWDKKPLLAAIDPTTSDAQHIALNRKILDYSQMLAYATKAEFHTINTFEVPSMEPAMGMGYVNIDFERVKRDTEKSHKQKMQRLLAEQDLASTQCHIVQGRPDIAIPKLAGNIDAQVVVLGTVGRTGLSAAFIGNTAEYILANLNCEILTLNAQ